MSKYFILFFLATWASFTYAQTDSIRAVRYLDRAKVCLKDNKQDSAAYFAEKSRAYFRQKDQLAGWLKSYKVLAQIWGINLKNPGQGVAEIELGMAGKWRDPNAPQEWEQYCLNLLAAGYLLQHESGDLFGAKQYYERAQEVFIHKMGEESDRVADFLYHNLGNIYTRIGDYERAISLFQRSIQYFNAHPKSGVVDHGDLAIALNEVGRHQEALLAVQKGLKIASLRTDQLLSLWTNEADAYLKMGRFAEAKISLKNISKILHAPETEDADEYLSQYYAAMAELDLALGHYTAAKTNALKAISAGKSYLGTEKRREIGKMYGLLGTVAMQRKQAAEALRYFHHALYCVLPDVPLKEVEKLPAVGTFYAENTILEALYGKAQAFIALKEPEKALACYELIPFVEAKLRSFYAYESSSLLALKESRQRFNEAVDLAWQCFEQSNGNPVFAERAFRLTELSRGMLLLQSLVLARQYLPADIEKQEYGLRVRMAWLEHEMAEEQEKGAESDIQKIGAWERQLFDLKSARLKLLADFPSYNNPDSLFLQVLAANDVSGLLRTDQVLVNYFLTENTAYIFSFDKKGGFYWRKQVLPTDFRAQTNAWVAYLWAGQEPGRETFLQKSWQLDSLLLAPERQRWSKHQSLLLVPDDVLMSVPFEVALSESPKSKTPWRAQPWLLVQYNIGYVYSATLLCAQQEISRAHLSAETKPRYNFGGFAPNYEQSGNYKLQNTQPMVQRICARLGGKWWGEESTEAQFKKTAAQYRMLLLAMHGISDSEHPELCRLLFGDPGPDSLINNNILYASELQIMRLNADLVVLSACHSGTGKLEQGEGMYSLARAFAAAQVPASVMSLWLLHENTAPPLVEAFFKYIQAGKTKDEALRLSKLDFLKNDQQFEMTHPFYWAGLAASGDMQALDLHVPIPWDVWGMIGLGMFTLTAMAWWSQRSKHTARQPVPPAQEL